MDGELIGSVEALDERQDGYLYAATSEDGRYRLEVLVNGSAEPVISLRIRKLDPGFWDWLAGPLGARQDGLWFGFRGGPQVLAFLRGLRRGLRALGHGSLAEESLDRRKARGPDGEGGAHGG